MTGQTRSLKSRNALWLAVFWVVISPLLVANAVIWLSQTGLLRGGEWGLIAVQLTLLILVLSSLFTFGVSKAALKLGQWSGPVFIATLSAVGISLVFSSGYVGFIEGQQSSETQAPLFSEGPGTSNSLAIAGDLVRALMLAPLTEEIVYRGLLMGVLLSRGWHPVLVVVVSALAFTIGHGHYSVVQAIPVFVGGLLLGALRVFSGGILTPILAHIGINGFTRVIAVL